MQTLHERLTVVCEMYRIPEGMDDHALYDSFREDLENAVKAWLLDNSTSLTEA